MAITGLQEVKLIYWERNLAHSTIENCGNISVNQIPKYAKQHVLALRCGNVVAFGPNKDVLTPEVQCETFDLLMEVQEKEDRSPPMN